MKNIKKIGLLLSFILLTNFSLLFAGASYEMKFGEYGTELGQFEFATDVAVDIVGNIYATAHIWQNFGLVWFVFT